MTTLQDIIDGGFRELNLIALGTSANTAQTAEGVRLLNQLYRFAIGGSAGEFMFNWPLGNYGRVANDYIQATTEQLRNPPANVRLVAVNDAAMTVNLPPIGRYLADGAQIGIVDPYSRLATYPVTLNPNGQTIEGASTLVLNTNAYNATWMYRADTGNWALLDNLTEADPNPFPLEFDPYFEIMLALRLSPRSGRELSDATKAYFKQASNKFVARYTQKSPLMLDPSLTWTSLQGYDQFYGWRYGSQSAFNQGWGSLGNGYLW